VRTDGGHVIEIRSVDPDGRTQAACYTPNPVNLARGARGRGHPLRKKSHLHDEY
jgi:hypothetical protein